QQPPRRADERTAAQVLLVAGLLAHQHDPGARRTLTENGAGGAAVQVAALAGLRRLAQGGQGQPVRQVIRRGHGWVITRTPGAGTRRSRAAPLHLGWARLTAAARA